MNNKNIRKMAVLHGYIKTIESTQPMYAYQTMTSTVDFVYPNTEITISIVLRNLTDHQRLLLAELSSELKITLMDA
jgi:hypothetical protein